MTSPRVSNDDSKDIFHAIKHIQKKYPRKGIFASGLSFGGNQLVRYLSSKYFKQGQISAAVGLGFPYAPFKVYNSMSNIYSNHLT